jgi:hypothetical protein
MASSRGRWWRSPTAGGGDGIGEVRRALPAIHRTVGAMLDLFGLLVAADHQEAGQGTN